MPGSDRDSWRPGRIALFLALGLALYAGLFAWADRLTLRHGDRNPLYRIVTAPGRADWLVLGASHAMPLGFAGMPATIAEATGQEVLVLGVTGAGPAVWRLLADRYFADRRAAAVLIVVDGFAFRDRRWNEDRIGQSDLLARMPWDPAMLAAMARALPRGLPVATLANYASGFSRINEPGRSAPDTWEGEARFDTAPRPSDAADRARIDYLYPPVPAATAALDRYLTDLSATVERARGQGAAVVLLQPPLPARFAALLPDEPAFTDRLAAFAAARGLALVDHRALLPDSRFYFDSDHLNRAGVTEWLARGLGTVLRDRGAVSTVAR